MSMPFRTRAFLLEHIEHTMAFYHPRAIDPRGGFFHFFRDDGTVYDARTRHLVSSTRFIFNYAMAWRTFKRPEYLEAVHHGLRYLRLVHRNAQSGGYAWLLRDARAVDATNHCYGLAFVLLSNSHAAEAGVPGAREGIAATFELMERRFWEPAHGLYADEATPDWQVRSYRGQNANMHACEAMQAAWRATKDRKYLDRAVALAREAAAGDAVPRLFALPTYTALLELHKLLADRGLAQEFWR